MTSSGSSVPSRKQRPFRIASSCEFDGELWETLGNVALRPHSHYFFSFGKIGFNRELLRSDWVTTNYGAKSFPTATNIVFR